MIKMCEKKMKQKPNYVKKKEFWKMKNKKCKKKRGKIIQQKGRK